MVLALDFVVDHAVQLVLGGARITGIAGSTLGVFLVSQNQLVGGVWRDFYTTVFQYLTQLAHRVAVGVTGADVEFGDRQLVGAGAAQLKAAGAQQNSETHHQQVAFDHVLLPLKPEKPTERP